VLNLSAIYWFWFPSINLLGLLDDTSAPIDIFL